MEVWLIEIAKGIGRLFINPLVYWFIFITFLTSLSRIKMERKQFGTKIFDVFSEWKSTWLVSLIAGIVISAIAIGLGFVLNYSVILLLAAISILFSVTKRFGWLSAAYTFGFTYLVILIIPYIINEQNVPSWVFEWIEPLQNFNSITFALLLGLFLIIEAILMIRVKQHETFPQLLKGNRGKWVGQHLIKKVTLIPFFALIPGEVIESFASWWPLLELGEETYGLIVVPVMIGFQHVVKGTMPIKATRSLSQSIVILGLLTLGLAIAGYYLSILATTAIVVALIGREFITYRFRTTDQTKQPFFSPEPTGLLILGVIPGTPAEKLGLLIGEKIIKVNGQPVSTEQEFYEALQHNSAFCKLDVRDERGEIKFVQRAMYQGEHHELGILFAKEQYRIKK